MQKASQDSADAQYQAVLALYGGQSRLHKLSLAEILRERMSNMLTGAYNGLSLNANGGVYASGSLSTYSEQVLSQPILFAFSHGAGLMDESGPEAIMPIKRGSDGQLGVKAVDVGGRGGDVIVNM